MMTFNMNRDTDAKSVGLCNIFGITGADAKKFNGGRGGGHAIVKLLTWHQSKFFPPPPPPLIRA